MARLRYPMLLLLALAVFLFLNFGLALAATLWADNPAARFVWTAENANANRTGLGLDRAVYGVVYERNVPGQLLHSAFALNTNSCASCHLTHQAPGSRQLFQPSIYNTCSTCHFDLTMDTHNVLSSLTAGGGRFFDGDFALQVEGRRAVSFHLTTGAYQHWQAPGSGFTAPPPAGSPWRQPFSCASCHGPHGTFSRRHLHFNINGQAPRFGPVSLVTVPGEVYLVPATYRDRTPWLHYDQNPPLAASHGVQIIDSLGVDVTPAFRSNNRLGQVFLERPAEAGTGPYHIFFSQATMVDLEVQGADTTTETVIYRGGVVNFCTACHTGYLQRRMEGDQTYLYTQHANFEHPIDGDLAPYVNSAFIADPPAAFPLEQGGGQRRLVCLSCHFAHGTDADRMTGRNLTDPAYPAGSSIPPQTRLLRFGSDTLTGAGNQEVCLVCHTSLPATDLAVLSTSPAAGSSTVTPPAEVIIRFNRRVDFATVILGETLRVFDTVYGTVYGTVAAADSHRTLVFTPQLPLLPGSYEVEVTTGVSSWFGRALPQLFYFVFSVDG